MRIRQCISPPIACNVECFMIHFVVNTGERGRTLFICNVFLSLNVKKCGDYKLYRISTTFGAGLLSFSQMYHNHRSLPAEGIHCLKNVCNKKLVCLVINETFY